MPPLEIDADAEPPRRVERERASRNPQRCTFVIISTVAGVMTAARKPSSDS